jgi:hypothetical protein
MSMPPDQGIWFHNHQCFSPAVDPTRQQYQQLPVARLHLRTPYLAFQHDQLLTEEYVFCDQLTFAARQIHEGTCYLGCFGGLRPALEPHFKPGQALLDDLTEFVLHVFDDQLLIDFRGTGLAHCSLIRRGILPHFPHGLVF